MAVQSDRTAIVSGSTGTLGPGVIQKFKSNGFQAYGGSRRRGDFQYKSSELTDTAFWYSKIAEYGKNSNTIQLVNLIGQPRGRGNLSLFDINVKPAITMAKAARQYAQDNPDKKVVMVQVSAIAATYLADHEYGQSRAQADFAVFTTATEEPTAPNFKAVVIQFPFIFSEPDENGHIKGLHPWSMEQIAGLPVIPVVNGGNQALYPVSHSDAILSIINAHKVNESQIVEARGSDCVNNREMILVYSRLAGRNPLFITLPSSMMATALDLIPHGLLDGYGPRLMQKLPSKQETTEEVQEAEMQPFQNLIEKKPDGIKEKHAELEEGDVTLESPPIWQHIRENYGVLGLVAAGVGAVGLGIIGGALYLAAGGRD